MLKIYYTYWNSRNANIVLYIGIGGEKDGICSRDHMCPGK
jgi:hypothetical protein